ncbi:MAG TPA: transglycosylase SLT domain-containing protein [Candidatus Binatia bacterium]|nr:transglycosylase SLT domain-containing protein [Candidatus Binatia bacterium]
MKQLSRWLLTLLLSHLAFLPAQAIAQRTLSAANPFPTPAGLEPAVEFWKKVFTEYSLSQLVFFDPLDMSNIYEVLDVGEESRSNQYIDGERSRIAAANGVEIERVKAQRGVRERTADGLKRAGRYLAQMQQVFIDRGLPPELSFLPVVESSYDMSARSNVGAVGIWQFMPATGRSYMRVDRLIDERRDPLESTRAAAAYLEQAYGALGSWPLAITSYNYGQAGMARAVAEIGSSNLLDLIQRYNHPYWGFAPKQFYAEFLAAVEIGKNLNQYFPGIEQDAPRRIQELTLASNTSMSTAISTTGLSQEEFMEWNPALSSGVRVLPAGYRVKLPADRSVEPIVEVARLNYRAPPPAGMRQVALAQSQQRQAGKAQVIHHRVQRGETLIQIAQRYGASVQRILQVNGIRQAHLVRAGITLRIPRV